VLVQGPILRHVDPGWTQDQNGREAEMMAQACGSVGTPSSAGLLRLRSAKFA